MTDQQVTHVVYEDDPLGKFPKGTAITERQARDYNIPLEPDGTSLADRDRKSPEVRAAVAAERKRMKDGIKAILGPNPEWVLVDDLIDLIEGER